MFKFILNNSLSNYHLSKLYVLYKQTLSPIYLNELYDRCYPTTKEEQEPTRQKIYKRHFKNQLIGIDKSK